jgi:MFS superfamily sulfate permease-like transporter
MNEQQDFSPFKNFGADIPASIIVFLVAMPLCLGVALASGAPLFSGIIAGIVGGIVVGAASGSPLGVSGPAAGLAVIVLDAITELQSFEVFLLAVFISGIFQLLMGFAKAGIIAYYFPSSVVHGMLAGIGILIFMKQLPHAVGYDADPEGDFSFMQVDGQNTFSELFNMLNYISPGVVLVSVISLAILILWETSFMKSMRWARIIQGPLVVVLVGVALVIGLSTDAYWNISADHMVNIPIAETLTEFRANFQNPDFSAWNNPAVWRIAAVLALVASIETLLCLEASDKQDTYKRTSPVNRELKAQGLGNIVAGLIGGIPVVQVIVRSSVNQQSGGKTKASAVMHGFLILFSVILIPQYLNLIPLATLAAILIVVGYKLARPTLFKKMYKQGWTQFIPFMTTVVCILLIDLLKGIGCGMAVALLSILYNNYKIPYRVEKSKKHQTLRLILSADVTFLNKASIQAFLSEVPNDVTVIIDASETHFIHHDVLELIEDFEVNARTRNITVQKIDLYEEKEKHIHSTPHFNVVAEED